MCHLKITYTSLIVLFISVIGYGQNHKSDPIRKTIFIIVDGIPEDVIKSVETPHLDAITREGAFLPAYVGGGAETYSETPTISAVGYNSLLTGTWANKHNVWDNDIVNPNYHYWTIFRLLKEQYPAKKMAIFSTWLDNRTKLIGTGLDATRNLRMDYYFDGFEYDTLMFPHDEAGDYIQDIDQLVAEEAAHVIGEQAPDLSWVYLQFTDNMGHAYGDHPTFHESIRVIDEQVGKIWEAVKEREENHNEEWLFIVTTDHGRTADTGKDHGGQSGRERNIWIITNHDQINQYGLENRLGIVDILPSVADYMNINIPRYRAMELDGLSFIGKADATKLRAEKSGDQVNLHWKAINGDKRARVWISTTNNFKYGGDDLYHLMGEVDISDEMAEFTISEIPSSFYKIVLETPHHYLSTWVVETKKK